jgi:preprotein translocase subunit SecY
MWTRWLTVPLAILQAFSMIQVLKASASGSNIFVNFHTTELIIGIFTITAGTIFMMWLGELISEKKIGNGISLLIFAGIVSTIPRTISQAVFNYTPSELVNMILFAIIGLITIIAVVIITEGQRNIPVQYARQVRGISVPGGVSTHLPMRVNMAGVIPIIFAISIILVPSTVAKMLIAVKTAWVAHAAQWVVRTMDPQGYVYMAAYFVLVVAFTYFYTAVIFHPDQIAENLQKQGGFVPGIRPGKSTADYLQGIVTKIVLTGALFLGVIAVLPLILAKATGTSFLVIGGTSLLIVVSVVIETVRQINSQLAMHDYDEI